LKPAWANRPYLKKNITNVYIYIAGAVAQGEGPEFKPQCCKKRENAIKYIKWKKEIYLVLAKTGERAILFVSVFPIAVTKSRDYAYIGSAVGPSELSWEISHKSCNSGSLGSF
jgi:hypothetical protein